MVAVLLTSGSAFPSGIAYTTASRTAAPRPSRTRASIVPAEAELERAMARRSANGRTDRENSDRLNRLPRLRAIMTDVIPSREDGEESGRWVEAEGNVRGVACGSGPLAR